MTKVTDNSVRAINAALVSIEREINALKSSVSALQKTVAKIAEKNGVYRA